MRALASKTRPCRGSNSGYRIQSPGYWTTILHSRAGSATPTRWHIPSYSSHLIYVHSYIPLSPPTSPSSRILWNHASLQLYTALPLAPLPLSTLLTIDWPLIARRPPSLNTPFQMHLFRGMVVCRQWIQLETRP